MDSIFIRTLCTDRIKIRAGQMTRHFRKSILTRLKEKYEGICSHHGYIRKNSIDIYKISPGEVLVHTLNGDIQYTVQYYADICNPTMGTSIRATVLNKNKFGLLAHVYDEGSRSATEAAVRQPILEIIVPRDSMPEEIDFDKIAKGASITISVLGKKFANRDTKISVVGSLLNSHSAPSGTLRDLTHDAVDSIPIEDEEEDIVDLENDEEEEEEDNDEDADEDAKSTQANEEEEDEDDFDEDLEEEEDEEEEIDEEDEDI